jgi:hydroxymethylglutaryl-CoA lyase
MAIEKVEIVEVSPRDGLQNEPEILSSVTKIALINRAIDCGFKRIEVASFVNPRRVPQMADAEAVVEALPQDNGVTYIGLALNERGAERALHTNIHEVGAVVCASDGFAMANQGQTSAQSADVANNIVAMTKSAGKAAQITISTAFGCPFDGPTNQDWVVELAAIVAQSKPREIALADTIGVATPFEVSALFEKVRAVVGEIPLRAHFHNTRNTGIANAYAAYQAGVRIIDASLGGLGGCPFAPNATGNIPTEDLVYMLSREGIDTGIDIDRMIETGLWLSEIMGRQLPAMLPRAGKFPA